MWKSRCTKHTILGPLLAVEMSKKCTPLWREAHFEFSKLTCTKRLSVGPLLEVEMWKSAHRCGAKHISKSKPTKHTILGPLLEVDMLKKCTPLWREAHFQVKSAKKLTGTDHVWTFRCCFAWQAQGNARLVKSEQNVGGFVAFRKNAGRHGAFEEDLQRCIVRGRRSTRDMFSRDVRRSGRSFPERVCVLEHEIFSFGKRILCVSGAALRMTWHTFFVAGEAL